MVRRWHYSKWLFFPLFSRHYINTNILSRLIPWHCSVVIFKHMFDPREFDEDPSAIIDIKQ